MSKPLPIQALYISDVHLGSHGVRATELLDVLKRYQPEKLYIVGDFIDGWILKHRHYWPQSHTNIIRKILSYSKNGTQIYYITGNHDDFLRLYDHPYWGNIWVLDEIIENGTWIIHGDRYDSVIINNRWAALLGTLGYEAIIRFDRVYTRWRNLLGLRPRSLSKWVKTSFKSAYDFITRFEDTLVSEAKRKNCSRVICGHMHVPADEMRNGIHYLNTGDWVESMTWITRDGDTYTLHHYTPPEK